MKFAVIAAAVLAAVFDHQIVDALAAMGFFHSDHTEYRHIAMLPALVGAVTVLVALVVMFRLDGRRDDRDWIVRLARTMRAIPWSRTLAAILVLQFVALFAMESIEQLLSSGRLFDPVAWLGTSLPLALIVGAFVSACVTALLRGTCDAVVRASRAIERFCRALVVAVRTRLTSASVGVRPASRRKMRASTSLLAFRSGLRAPPAA